MKLFRKPAIPLNVQFEAACAGASVHEYRRVTDILAPYGYPKWAFDHHRRLNKHLTFTSDQLLEYLRQRPEICEKLMTDCTDKRVSASTVIRENLKTNKYLVYYFDANSIPTDTDILTFDTIEESATDYVLFSLGMPRLK
jgi:hypothetical protein